MLTRRRGIRKKRKITIGESRTVVESVIQKLYVLRETYAKYETEYRVHRNRETLENQHVKEWKFDSNCSAMKIHLGRSSAVLDYFQGFSFFFFFSEELVTFIVARINVYRKQGVENNLCPVRRIHER